MTIENIINSLVEQKGYDRELLESVADKIEGFSEDIRAAFEKWIETDEITSPEYSCYTVEKILKIDSNMTVLSAYLNLDWVRREPTEAINVMTALNLTFIPPEIPDIDFDDEDDEEDSE